jgi:hypothetical protein
LAGVLLLLLPPARLAAAGESWAVLQGLSSPEGLALSAENPSDLTLATFLAETGTPQEPSWIALTDA